MAKQRIDKIFSGLGILSRSECKRAVKNGEISVNGIRCASSDIKIDTEIDKICYKDRPVDTREFVYYMLNKPAGFITANDDRYSRTVFDLISDKRTDLSAVGRLDKDTTGILLITNDGDINHRLLSPRYHVPKTYKAELAAPLNPADILEIEKGIDIGDEKLTLPAKCRIPDELYPCRAELTITEGRFHQVKRMFETVGKPVIRLHRSSFGPLDLDERLKPGEYRELTADELKLINEAAGRHISG